MPQKMMFKYGIDKLTIPKIIDISKNQYSDDAGIGGGEGKGMVEKKIRDAELYGVHLNKETGWIFDKLGNIISAVNTHHFDYDLVKPLKISQPYL